jgi:uncharacterized protein YodC (DUF2158 family)
VQDVKSERTGLDTERGLTSMAKLKSFAPEHLVPDAQASGFYQCRDCGMVWFGRDADERCPNGHGLPVHVVVLCRTCDFAIPLDRMAQHIATDHEHTH